MRFILIKIPFFLVKSVLHAQNDYFHDRHSIHAEQFFQPP